MKKIFKKYIVEIILMTIALIFTITSLLIFLKNNEETEDEINLPKQTNIQLNKIYVDVSGSVNKPDLYETPSGTRLKEIIQKAGGLSDNADKNFFYRNFNLARVLNDQEKIYIPSVWEVQAGLFTENQQTINFIQPNYNEQINNNSTLINVNEATIDELDSLPGIGKTTAQKIIDNRPYQSIEDLLNKKIVNKSTYEKIKSLISL